MGCFSKQKTVLPSKELIIREVNGSLKVIMTRGKVTCYGNIGKRYVTSLKGRDHFPKVIFKLKPDGCVVVFQLRSVVGVARASGAHSAK